MKNKNTTLCEQSGDECTS